MPLLTYARDPESGTPLFAVIADDQGAEYLWPDDVEPWFDDDRVQQLAQGAATPPATASEWLALATYNVGQDIAFSEPVELELDAAVDDAEETLKDFVAHDGSEALLSRTSSAFDEVGQDYPGFMESDETTTPEAMANFVMMALGPIDPDGPNGWLLRAQDGTPAEGDEDAFVVFDERAANMEARG